MIKPLTIQQLIKELQEWEKKYPEDKYIYVCTNGLKSKVRSKDERGTATLLFQPHVTDPVELYADNVGYGNIDPDDEGDEMWPLINAHMVGGVK